MDEIRNRLTLSEIVGRRVKLTRAGREFKGCCPFHHEKTPSFTVNDEKAFYHCFGCGAHGDALKFMTEHENLPFIDAVKVLAGEAGLQVPEFSPEQAKKAKKQKDLYELMDEACRFFENYLFEPRNRDALSYITDRGFSIETIKTFRIGFSSEDGQELRKFLEERGYSSKEMIEAGLLKPSTRGTEPYAFFRGRVTFPVIDRRSRVVAFGGRILPEHMRPPSRSDFTPPKYINSSETVLFHKGQMLYGEPQARRAAADGQKLLVVEGYMDVIACAQAGIHGALAPMGTALTSEQILALWKMIPSDEKVPVLCFDGDNAGKRAASRVAENILPLLEPGKSVAFAFLPEGEDPDSLVQKNGAGALKRFLDKPMSLIEFIWQSQTQGREFKTPESRAGAQKILFDIVDKIANRDVQVHYRTLLKQKISETFFPRRNNDFNNRNKKGGRRPILTPPRPPSAQINTVVPKAILAAIMNHPHIFERAEEVFVGLQFKQHDYARLRDAVVMELSDDPEISRDNLLESLKKSGFSQEIGDILNESVYVHASFSAPGANEEEVTEKFLAYVNDANGAELEREIKGRWKKAYLDSSEEEETKLRHLISMQTAEGA